MGVGPHGLAGVGPRENQKMLIQSHDLPPCPKPDRDPRPGYSNFSQVFEIRSIFRSTYA
jgi:hypothetical protein